MRMIWGLRGSRRMKGRNYIFFLDLRKNKSLSIMTDPTYKVEYNTNKDHYKFESIGPNGNRNSTFLME